MKVVARLTLLAYPRRFRREYGAEYHRTVEDLRKDGHQSTARIVRRLVADALTTAPTMRWERLMSNRTSTPALIAVLTLVCIAIGTVVGPPAVIALVAAILFTMLLAARLHDRPLATELVDVSRRWYLWLLGGGVLFLIGGAMLLTSDGGELTSVAWAVGILSWLAGCCVAATGLGLGMAHLLRHRRP